MREDQLVHGPHDVRHHVTASTHGRGGIVWTLRGLLARAVYNLFVYGRQSNRPAIEDGSMTLGLRLRPTPFQAAGGSD